MKENCGKLCCAVRLLPTAYVVRREGYVLTHVCPSVCLSTPRGKVPWPGPAGGGVPLPGPVGGLPHLAGGIPHLGFPLSAGGVPLPRGTPPQVHPLSDLARRLPLPGGTSPWVPPIRPGQGVPLLGGVPHLGYPTVRPGWRYPAGGYPTSSTPPPRQTWPGGTPPRVTDGST